LAHAVASIERKYTVFHYFGCSGIVHGPLTRQAQQTASTLAAGWLMPIRVLWALENARREKQVHRPTQRAGL